MSTVSAQIHVKDSNGNLREVQPKTSIENVSGLQSALNNKVDAVSGKDLSTNDYTTAEKNKLSGIEANANDYVHPTTSGNKHIPSGGSSGKILGWSADGTAAWVDPTGGGGGDVSSVKVGSTTYNPDSSGVVSLPAYPTSLPASDVYSWAKSSSKPSYTASEVGAIATTSKGANNGVASLDSSGKVPSSQLPSSINDVVEQKINGDYLVARRHGKTVTINGYVSNMTFTANTEVLIGTVNTSIGRPVTNGSVRTLCNIGPNAYSVGTVGYLIIQKDGKIYANSPYSGTGAIYFSCSYTIS